VLAAVALDGVEDTVSQLLVINGAVGLLALSGAGVLAGVVVRRSLRPLLEVEATAQAIAEATCACASPRPTPARRSAASPRPST
jgi:two-component system OmpR family sensor kinase